MSFAAEFVAGMKRLDAERLQQSAKAAIQSNGRLSLTVEAGRLMHLSDDRSIVIFAAANGDLGAIVSHKGDKQAFDLKKAGAYYYLTFKNYLQEQGIDYKNQRIMYDITELEEKFEGKTVYRFARRVLPKEAKELPVTGEPSPFADEEDEADEIEQQTAGGAKSPATAEPDDSSHPPAPNPRPPSPSETPADAPQAVSVPVSQAEANNAPASPSDASCAANGPEEKH